MENFDIINHFHGVSFVCSKCDCDGKVEKTEKELNIVFSCCKTIVKYELTSC